MREESETGDDSVFANSWMIRLSGCHRICTIALHIPAAFGYTYMASPSIARPITVQEISVPPASSLI